MDIEQGKNDGSKQINERHALQLPALQCSVTAKLLRTLNDKALLHATQRNLQLDLGLASACHICFFPVRL